MIRNIKMKKTYVLFGLLIVMLLFTGIASAWDVPVLSNEVPSDASTLWDMNTASVNITIYTANTSTNWTIDFTPDIGNSSGTYGNNGSKTCDISGMLYSTTYTWVVTSFNANGTDESGNWTNASYTFTTRPAKLRENAEFNVMEKAIVGVVGIIILLGFLYIVLKTDYKKDKALAKIFVGLIIALALLTVIFSALQEKKIMVLQNKNPLKPKSHAKKVARYFRGKYKTVIVKKVKGGYNVHSYGYVGWKKPKGGKK